MVDSKQKRSSPRTSFLTLPLEIRQKILLASKDHLQMPKFDHAKADPPKYRTVQARQRHDFWFQVKVSADYVKQKDSELRQHKGDVKKWAASLSEIEEIRVDMRWVRKMWKKEIKRVAADRGLMILW
ncbi:hypothetical protein E6O75_ATG06940 [Venturia nashicola]|uniref:Uncharacterized protein n=1 Tax=Venturia nashicola TaxID=86259 RepID=A0A4Z1NWW5_9PEZI|nr:hypothetical protein E6O75_ATG06940 [Venturia nashicola]